MLDFSLGEVMLIVVVTVVFVGPKELPAVVRTVSKGMRSVRALTKEVKDAIDEMTRETGIKEAHETLDAELRMIRGDDGKMYESYDVKHITPQKADDERQG